MAEKKFAFDEPGDLLKAVVADAVAYVGAKRIEDVGELVLFTIPDVPGSFNTASLLDHAFTLAASENGGG